MNETIAALLELHDVNRQRLVLVKDRTTREDRLGEASKALKAVTAAREAAEQAVHSNDALTRQYTADLERCDNTIAKLREQQMQAKTNKEYLACINGIENAKSEKKLRTESLTQLAAEVEAKQAAVEAAKAKEADVAAAVEKVEAEVGGGAAAEISESELDRMYAEKKTKVDPKFLEIYERLVTSKHPMPLMKVDGATRATPMGNMISTQQLELLRLGHLVTDQGSNAILYVNED
ncbi:MAG: hypothetical protein PF961_04055 [Planctomycetota bacterium]|jgi:predicted  nucleic acid-binding Zn-ribbon protein|nr:hypothetical protein [Planctomycetota bacterium]